MREQDKFAGWIRFDAVGIDVDGHRLLVSGSEVPLERKAFAVLALLASHPGRVFTREEILDAVWGHAHVTPGVLNRIVTLLRQALGESGEAHRYLHTVHGVGYRFDLPSSAVASGALGTGAVEPRVADIAAHQAGDQTHAPPARIRAAFWLIPLLIVLALAGWALRAQRAAPPAAPVGADGMSATPTLVVMPLKAIGDGNTRLVADGLSEELIFSLARIDDLRVIARESTLLASVETGDPAQLVQRLGITHALEGNLQQAGQSLRVRLRLIDAGSGTALWVKEFDRDASEILLLQREIAEAVAASLALKLGLSTEPSPSGDAEFLRRYLAARALVVHSELPMEESTERAVGEFRALLRERPDDARTHAGLAFGLELLARRKPALGASVREEAVRVATIAKRLDPALPEPYAVLAADACNRNDWERCLELGAKSLEVAPSNTDVVYGNVTGLARLGYLEQAEAVLRELAARDPLSYQPHLLLGRILDFQGRHDEAHIELDQAPIDGAYARWYNAVWRGDYADALRIAETQIGAPDHPDPSAHRLAPGYVAASRAFEDPSLWPLAVAEFDEFERHTDLWNFCRVLTPDAASRAAEWIHELNQVRQRSYSRWDLLLWAKDLAWLRRDPAFQHFLRDNGILAYWRKHGFPPQCRAEGDDAICE